MFLGIDIGSSAIKLDIFSKYNAVFHTETDLITYTWLPGEAYQTPHDIMRALTAGIQAIPAELKRQVTQIGLSTAMHSLLVNESSEEKIYIWSDSQAEAQISTFHKTPLAQEFYLKTGTPIHPMTPFAKLLRQKELRPIQDVPQWYGLKEWLMMYLTGEYVVDLSNASATGLFNLHQQKWDTEILQYLGITESSLARVVPCDTTFAIRSDIAATLGFDADVSIMIGSSDGCLASFASYQANQLPNTLTIGTSATIRKISRKIKLDPQQQNFCYLFDDQYYVTGAPSNNGGIILQWAADIFYDEPTTFYEQLTTHLTRSPIGANGLLFMPYLNHERAPFWRTDITGQFCQLQVFHTRSDMIRSVVEGILLNLSLLKKMVDIQGSLAISGGFFKNPQLTQLTADLLGIPLIAAEQNEPNFGLYLLSKKTAPQIEEPSLAMIQPDLQKTKMYQPVTQAFERKLQDGSLFNWFR